MTRYGPNDALCNGIAHHPMGASFPLNSDAVIKTCHCLLCPSNILLILSNVLFRFRGIFPSKVEGWTL